MRGSLRALLVAPALAIALFGAACGEDQPTIGGGGAQETATETEDNGAGKVDIGGQEANDHGSEDVAGDSELELELDSFYFEPTVLEGDAGQSLSLELHNESDDPHTFTIEDQGVDVEVQPGQTAQAEITFPDSGALVFVCRFHDGQGMRGALSVGGDLGAAVGGETGGGGGGDGGGGEDGGGGKY